MKERRNSIDCDSLKQLAITLSWKDSGTHVIPVILILFIFESDIAINIKLII